MPRKASKPEMTKHARRRARQRYGTLSKRQIDHIANLIANGSPAARKENSRTRVWIVKAYGREFRVVYDQNEETVVTFLPCRKMP